MKNDSIKKWLLLYKKNYIAWKHCQVPITPSSSSPLKISTHFCPPHNLIFKQKRKKGRKIFLSIVVVKNNTNNKEKRTLLITIALANIFLRIHFPLYYFSVPHDGILMPFVIIAKNICQNIYLCYYRRRAIIDFYILCCVLLLLLWLLCL